jgi:hypothetical protein
MRDYELIFAYDRRMARLQRVWAYLMKRKMRLMR